LAAGAIVSADTYGWNPVPAKSREFSSKTSKIKAFQLKEIQIF